MGSIRSAQKILDTDREKNCRTCIYESIDKECIGCDDLSGWRMSQHVEEKLHLAHIVATGVKWGEYLDSLPPECAKRFKASYVLKEVLSGRGRDGKEITYVQT